MDKREYETKAQYAARRLRSALVLGDLRPGAKLDMEELTSWLGVSATPIREAFRVLEAEGAIVNEPHRGARVPEVRGEDVTELYALRALLEGYATEQAADRLTDQDLDTLDALASRHAAAVAADDVDLAGHMNHDFHWLIYRQATSSSYLTDVISRLWNAFPSVSWTLYVKEGHQRGVPYHRELVDALRKRDSKAAAWVMRDHIESTGSLVAARLRAISGLVDPPAQSTPSAGVSSTTTPVVDRSV